MIQCIRYTHRVYPSRACVCSFSFIKYFSLKAWRCGTLCRPFCLLAKTIELFPFNALTHGEENSNKSRAGTGLTQK